MAISTVESRTAARGWSISGLLKNVQWQSIALGKGGKVSRAEIIFFLDQLTLMLETGTPLNKSIQAIGFQVRNSEFKTILKGLENEIEEGRLLSDAMAKYPYIFSPIYRSMIRAGESGGFLKEMLDRIVTLERKNQEFISTIRAALYYPAFLSIFAVSVVLFIIIYVFPKFGEMFEDVHDSLPITTRILMASSNFMTSYWYFILLFMGIAWFAAYKFIMTDKGRRIAAGMKLKVPFFKEFFIKLYISRFMRTLGSLINGNVPLLESLTICSSAVGNKVFSNIIDNIRDSVEEGKPLSKPISDSPYFPETVKQMVRTGEDTGTLHKVMPRLADFFEKDIEKSVKKVTTIIEPVLLVLVGGVVGIIVISLILPIFKITKSIH